MFLFKKLEEQQNNINNQCRLFIQILLNNKMFSLWFAEFTNICQVCYVNIRVFLLVFNPCVVNTFFSNSKFENIHYRYNFHFCNEYVNVKLIKGDFFYEKLVISRIIFKLSYHTVFKGELNIEQTLWIHIYLCKNMQHALCVSGII